MITPPPPPPFDLPDGEGDSLTSGSGGVTTSTRKQAEKVFIGISLLPNYCTLEIFLTD
jgi:hypothetical protein